jgi:hypothetical protein
MPSLRVHRASDEFARELAARVARWLLLGLGLVLMVVALMIVLRNSFRAKRQFVRAQRAHPNMVFPLRRLMRREPEIVQVFWQQYLRVERLVLPSRFRFAVKSRRYFKGRFKRTVAA